jgi:hypothetical protein
MLILGDYWRVQGGGGGGGGSFEGCTHGAVRCRGGRRCSLTHSHAPSAGLDIFEWSSGMVTLQLGRLL